MKGEGGVSFFVWTAGLTIEFLCLDSRRINVKEVSRHDLTRQVSLIAI